MKGKQIGDFWRDKTSGLWHVQLPHGEWTFRTKKKAKVFAAALLKLQQGQVCLA